MRSISEPEHCIKCGKKCYIKIDRCFDMLRKCNQHLQTYIRRSIVVDNDKLREYAKRAVLRKARHIVKLSETIRYYQNGGNQ